MTNTLVYDRARKNDLNHSLRLVINGYNGTNFIEATQTDISDKGRARNNYVAIDFTKAELQRMKKFLNEHDFEGEN